DSRGHASGHRRRGNREGAGRRARSLQGLNPRMPTNIIMPALELAQETGKIIHWLKRPGDPVQKGEPVVEIETDKVTVELEAPASGVLRDVSAREGDVGPVGRTIAGVFAVGEAGAASVAGEGRAGGWGGGRTGGGGGEGVATRAQAR